MKITNAYKKWLKGEFYKCLCKFEKNEDGLRMLISSLLYELNGLHHVADNMVSIIRLTSILNQFQDDFLNGEFDVLIIRKMVFKSMDLIDALDECGDTI